MIRKPCKSGIFGKNIGKVSKKRKEKTLAVFAKVKRVGNEINAF